MAWIELTDRRAQKVKHYYDPDTDKYRAVLTIHDQHFKDDFDDWMDVDENFEPDTGGFDRKCDKTRHAIHIANGGNRRWYPRRNVTTEYVDILGIEYYTNRWRSLTLPTPVWTNNKTEWDMTNLYAAITNTWRRIKTEFILKNVNAYTRLRFQVAFVGLTYNPTTGELTSTTDGLVWGYITPPYAYDANGNEENHNVTVTQTYDGTYIEWSVDTTGATFPIYVDPTFTDGFGGDANTAYDTYNSADVADNNQATDVQLNLYSTNHALLKFNLATLVGKTINSANLYLYISTGAWFEGSTNINRILSANSSWTETGATWNYALATSVRWAGDTDNNGGANAGCSVSGTDYATTAMSTRNISGQSYTVGTEFNYSLGLTEFGSMVNDNYGIVMYGTASELYGSSDNATTGYRPKLVVDYEDSGGECNTVVVMEVNTVVTTNTVVQVN